MTDKNPYFPNLFSPIKVGSKTIKNRIEAAPALFAFLHFIEGFAFNYEPGTPERAFRMLEAKAAGGAGSVVLGELSPNHTYDKRFPFEPEIDYHSRSDEYFQIMKKTDVNGPAAEPIFEYLKAQAPTEEYKGLKAKTTHALLKKLSTSVEKDSDILWNFTKFLISKDGETIKRFAPTTAPKDFEKDIQEML